MNTQVLNKIEASYLKAHPKFNVGDTIAVTLTIRDDKGGKRRSQIFKGLVIAIKGQGTGTMFTIRKISYGVGVEKILPLHSPNVEDIKILKVGKVRRSKIYFMRDRIGKKAMKVNDLESLYVADEAEAEVEAAVEAAPEVTTEEVAVAENGDEADKAK